MLARILAVCLIVAMPAVAQITKVSTDSLIGAIAKLETTINADYAVGLVSFSSSIHIPPVKFTPYVVVHRDKGVESANLRMVCQYTGDQVIDTKAVVASSDGDLSRHALQLGSVLTTFAGGRVSERCDIDDARGLIFSIANGNDCYLTMAGTHGRRHGGRLSASQIDEFIDIYDCWRLVNRLIDAGIAIHGDGASRIQTRQKAIQDARRRRAAAISERLARIERKERERREQRELGWQAERERVAKRRREERRKHEVAKIRGVFSALSVSVKIADPPPGAEGDWYQLTLRNGEEPVDNIVARVFGKQDTLPTEKLIKLHARKDEVQWPFKWVKVSGLGCEIVSFDGYDVEDLMSPDAHNKVLREKTKKAGRGRVARRACRRCGGTRVIRCSACFGRGALSCRKCAGTGKVNKAESLKGGYTRYKKIKCDTCDGKGGHTCKRCGGRKTETCPHG